MSYGTSIADAYRRGQRSPAGVLAKPSELPMMQPTSLDLLINLETAKALRPRHAAELLALADEVIE